MSGDTVCSACGRCEMELFGSKKLLTDFACPLRQGKARKSMPASVMGIPLLSYLADLPVDGFTATGRWKMVRPNGAVVFDIEFALRG
mmetsp:Transcript_25041/g.68432  ORF Transcript_25041/g.68432 Transcript_25041/m.68432 type:complete len:87 (-) Transcript_25041:81-341(-)